MGSKTYDGVWFTSYSADHWPPHVHGEYAGVRIAVEFEDGKVWLAKRSIRQARSFKQSDVKHILLTATRYADDLVQLWRKTHG